MQKKINNLAIKYFKSTLFISKVLRRTKICPNSIQKSYNNARQNQIVRLLSRKYADIIQQYQVPLSEEHQLGNYVWLFWWQGIETAPQIVQDCVAETKKVCEKNQRKLIIINQDNYTDYVDLPSLIVNKFKNHKMPTFHFADILRFKLIYQHGGLWMDATNFITPQFDFSKTEHDFYSIQSPNPQYYDVSHGKWATFILSGSVHSPLFKFVYEFLVDYWKHNDRLLDYFLVDYVLRIAYTNNIDQFPAKINHDTTYYSNPYFFLGKMNAEMEPQRFKAILEASDFYKLTYKYQQIPGTNRIDNLFNQEVRQSGNNH
ncbi:capsular polysaccharide synthesis protein [Fructilactobacillus myrtifloralis]|uniref:Capsular polysaccharide synthesis protein n=1 Tax=Fructilactobacillus myrtifloralis TaxID=2940301 RepID=A0ABY5BR65_9LACO|nr:capsular polysaccharide synthesis protein [Fructilactobacillus myrtifloralis]USS84723.1 capsular polysaccharide synthesis protein [Fructilactobacillus myrtifloralis]